MFKGAMLFGFVFAFIAPQTRAFIFDMAGKASDNFSLYAPYSYYFVGVLSAALLFSVLLIKMWPERQGMANPMAKYNRQSRFDD